MRVYVASGSDNRALATAYMERLRAAGVELTLDWAKLIDQHGGKANRGLSDDVRLQVAEDEVDAVERASLFWLIIPAGASCGCWFEFGIARSLPVPILVVSGDFEKSIFTALADNLFATHDEACKFVIDSARAWDARCVKCGGERPDGDRRNVDHAPVCDVWPNCQPTE